MPAKRGRVHVAEDIEHDERGGLWLTATFRASWQTSRAEPEALDGVGIDAAIAWARERSDWVMVRLGDTEHFWAGVGRAPGGTLAWPPPVAPRRRRHPDYAYLDRTPEDPPIRWDVTAWLGPRRDSHTVWEAGLQPDVLDDLAAQTGARWDDDARRELAADMDKARRAARRRGSDDYGWASNGRDAYRLRWQVSASTMEQAETVVASGLALPPDLVLENLSVAPN